MKLFLLLTLCAGAAAASNNSFTWTADPGAFTVDSLTMTAPAPFGERVVAAIIFKGVNNKTLTAGTVKYQVYEDGVTSFSSQGNFAYFHCTQHDGCDVAAPMALALEHPYKVPTNYT